MPSHRFFTAQPGFENTPQPAEGVLVVMPNDMGNSVLGKDGAGLGDAGRKAQAVANQIGCTVLAFDRPGTGNNEPREAFTEKTYLDTIAETGEFLQNRIETHPYKGGNRFDKIVVAGNSAGGSDAIQLVRHGYMRVTHLAVMDPIGVRKVSVGGGFGRWAMHQLVTERRYPHLPRPESDKIEDKQPVDIGRLLADMRTYRDIWSSPLAADGLRYAAQYMGRVAAQVEFPAHTFNNSRRELKYLCKELLLLQSLGRQRTAPFDARVVPGTLHSSGSNFTYFGQVIQRVLGVADSSREN